MNAIALVFGLLLIFTCTFSLSLRKMFLAKPIERTYQANNKAFQGILNEYETTRYERLKAIKEEPDPKSPKVERDSEQLEKQPPKPRTKANKECARLNLWPLIEENKTEHAALYQAAAQILKNLYGKKFSLPQKFEYVLLDALINTAKEELKKKPQSNSFIMEKFALIGEKKSSLPLIYYYMLKGTKQIPSEQGYPSLLEIFVLEKELSSLCLKHASNPLLEALFGERVMKKIVMDRKNKKNSFDREYLSNLCQREGNFFPSAEFLDLFNFQGHHAKKNQKILVQDEQDVCLKKKVFFAS